jgi:thymidylate kinase
MDPGRDAEGFRKFDHHAGVSVSRGRLIVFEGPEGVGKTTQLRLLGEWLEERGLAHTRVREPGGTRLGDEIRRLLLDPENEIGPRAEALLFMASRAALITEIVQPALERGELVLADRFFLSTFAYQIEGRGLPESEIRGANAFATGGLVPDLTLLFTAPSEERSVRRALRGSTDRMERAGSDFHARVEQAFARCLAPDWQVDHPECGPIVPLDATGSEAQVLERVLVVLGQWWPQIIPVLDGSLQ